MQRLYGCDTNRRPNIEPAVGMAPYQMNQNMDKYQNTYRIDSARLKNYNYANPGLYFVTICTANHEHFFGEIVDGEMQLSSIGVIADVLWHEIKHHSPNIALHGFVIMPNHIHGIIEILEPDTPTDLPRRDVTRNVTESDTTSTMSQISPKSSSLGRIIGAYKGSVTKHASRFDLAFSWQPRFYDHIIRDHEALVKIREYIINNPMKWAEDKLFTPAKPGDVACNASTPSPNAGFTLVELVVTIVIIGILASLGGMFISRPIEGYVDLKRRTTLVDQAEMALRRMQRDVRAALPNSVRVFGNGKGIEFLHVVDGGRYRNRVAPGAIPPEKQDNVLKFNQADDTFEVLGGLQHFADVDLENDRVVVYNLAATGTQGNAYFGDNSAKLASSTTATIIKLDPGKKFSYPSPYQRFFIVDEPISYIIEYDTNIGEYVLNRYSGYSINNAPIGPDPSERTEGYRALAAKHIDADKSYFNYNSGTSSRSGLVTMYLALEDKGERITLLHQVHVDNAP